MQALQKVGDPWWRQMAAATSGDMNDDSFLFFCHSMTSLDSCVSCFLILATTWIVNLLSSDSRLNPKFSGVNQVKAWAMNICVLLPHLWPSLHRNQQHSTKGLWLLECLLDLRPLMDDSESSNRMECKHLQLSDKCLSGLFFKQIEELS